MGRGDMKSRKGKISRGSYGNRRKRKTELVKAKARVARAAAVKAK